MDHRFQVFVSSTYSDLVEERAKVAQAIVEADCFPAGMEAFPASGDEQFDYIKKVIDQSDYYVLIIGGRYGSQSASGISYTEMEFNYAVGRGIPVLAFPHKDPDALPIDRRDMDDAVRQRLSSFRERVLSDRLAKMWVDADTLANQVMRALLKISRENPGVGWLRASSAQIESIQGERDAALQRCEDLESENVRLNAIISKPAEDLSGGDDQVSLEYTYSNWSNNRSYTGTRSVIVTWNQILISIGPELLDWRNEASVSIDVSKLLDRMNASTGAEKLVDESRRTLTVQFMALGLIDRQRLPTANNSSAFFWRLTDAGKHQLFRLRPIRK